MENIINQTKYQDHSLSSPRGHLLSFRFTNTINNRNNLDMAKVVIPGYPHHIIQQGNRRQEIF